MRAEYRYADFSTDTRTGLNPHAGDGGLTVNYDLAVKTHTALFGLAYKLDWGSPLIAN